MPGRDRTGPMKQGPMTGWGAGPCGAGAGVYFGRGRGMGRGRGRGFAAGGAGRGRGWFGRGRGYGLQALDPGNPRAAALEKELLQNQVASLESELSALRERLDELDKGVD